MALKERTVVDRVEVIALGNLHVREAKEIYDDQTGKVKAQTYHRYVVDKDKPTPEDVQAFLDNSKA